MIPYGQSSRKNLWNTLLFLAAAGLFFVFSPKSPYGWLNQLLSLGFLIPSFFMLSKLLSLTLSVLILSVLSGLALMNWVTPEVFEGLRFFIQWALFYWGVTLASDSFGLKGFWNRFLTQLLVFGTASVVFLFNPELSVKSALILAFLFSFPQWFPQKGKKKISIFMAILAVFVLGFQNWQQGLVLGGTLFFLALSSWLYRFFLFQKVKQDFFLFSFSFAAALFSLFYSFPVFLLGFFAGLWVPLSKKRKEVFGEDLTRGLILLFCLSQIRFEVYPLISGGLLTGILLLISLIRRKENFFVLMGLEFPLAFFLAGTFNSQANQVILWGLFFFLLAGSFVKRKPRSEVPVLLKEKDFPDK